MISNEMDDKSAYYITYTKEDIHNSKSFIENKLTLERLDSLSILRLKTAVDSVLDPIKQTYVFSHSEFNRILKISRINRLAISDAIGLINSIPVINDSIFEVENLNKIYTDVLNAEREFWISINNYILKYQLNNEKNNELLFIEIDYKENHYFTTHKIYESVFVKLQKNKDYLTEKRKEKFAKMESEINKQKRLRNLCSIGIIFSALLLFPFMQLIYIEFIKNKKQT